LIFEALLSDRRFKSCALSKSQANMTTPDNIVRVQDFIDSIPNPMKLLTNLKITDLGGGHFGSVAQVSYPDGSTSVREFLLPVDVRMDLDNHTPENVEGSIWKFPLTMTIDMTQTDGLLMSDPDSSDYESSDDESMRQPEVFKNGLFGEDTDSEDKGSEEEESDDEEC